MKRRTQRRNGRTVAPRQRATSQLKKPRRPVAVRKPFEQVRQALSHYRQIFETAREGIWTLDSADRVALVNQAMAEMLGYSNEELLGRSVFEFFDEENQRIVRERLERRRRGITDTYDLKFRRKDGTELWAIVSASALIDDHGCYAGALAFVTDITARRRVEDQLRKSESATSSSSERPMMQCGRRTSEPTGSGGAKG